MSLTKSWLQTLLRGEDLTEAQAGEVLRYMTDAEGDPAVKGALLAALRAKGETAAEVRGMAQAMRGEAVAVALPDDGVPAVDTCGTGGDGSDSFNVSTATALLAAAAGVRVVKHGNRSVSSRSGSTDVLEALGVGMVGSPEAAKAQLEALGFAFLFAPKFHPAVAAVVPVRRALKVRTVFNVLGPLSNPAAPPFQLLGAWSEEVAELMAHALAGMAITKAFVVHGAPCWDEATPCGPFVRFTVEGGQVVREVIDPAEVYGLARCAPEDLAGGDAAHNAGMMRALFEGQRGAVRDAVVLNTALVLELVGRCQSPREAVALAEQTLDSGAAADFLAQLAAWEVA